jgi:hypothetical protein
MEGVMNPPARGPVGHPAEVAAGIITAITAVRAPAQAPASQQVTIEVDIVNITDSRNYLAATAQDAGVSFSVSPGYALVDAWAKYTSLITFTMPSRNLRVNIYSWWWDGSKWVADDSGYVDIALGAVTPQFRGFGIADYSKV